VQRRPVLRNPPEAPSCPAGWRTGPPDFVGIGAQRCGTSWWFREIVSHPTAQGSPLGKELHYFDGFWAASPPPDLASRYAALFPRPEGRLVGEWTPRYMADLSSIRLLREAAPEARLLVLLRDPIERYRSALRRYRELDAKKDRPFYASDCSDAVWRGTYASQLERVFEFFPRDQVKVLQYERCVREPATELVATFGFLGLTPPPATRQRPRPFESSRPAPLERAVIEDLRNRYDDEVERLTRLCPEIDVSLWPNFSEPVSGQRHRPAAEGGDDADEVDQP
jgi:Sulfotransferase domain